MKENIIQEVKENKESNQKPPAEKPGGHRQEPRQKQQGEQGHEGQGKQNIKKTLKGGEKKCHYHQNRQEGQQKEPCGNQGHPKEGDSHMRQSHTNQVEESEAKAEK